MSKKKETTCPRCGRKKINYTMSTCLKDLDGGIVGGIEGCTHCVTAFIVGGHLFAKAMGATEFASVDKMAQEVCNVTFRDSPVKTKH